jgi:hypothetical protein
MAYNGPAIWGGCVTRRKHRAWSWYFSQKSVTVQGGYGACFCRPGTSLIEHYACRGTSLIGAGKLSRYRIFIGDTGPAEAGVQTVSKPESCQGAGIKLLAVARVRVQEPLQICLVSRSKSKNRDKHLTHIVRVRWS